MNRKAYVIALASPVHPQIQRTTVLEKILKIMESSGLETEMIAEPVSSIEEVWSIRHKILSVDGPLMILHLTGGTSKLAVEVAKWCNSAVTLVAHSESNSLPSSFEARARLRRLGLNAEVKIIDLVRGKLGVESGEISFKGCMGILGEVSPRTFDFTCPATIAQRLNVRVKHLTQEELERYLEKHKQNSELTSQFLSEFRGTIDVSTQELQLSLALKEAVKEALEKIDCNVFTIDCFEVIKKMQVTPCLAISLLSADGILGVCEADVQAAACMMAIKELTHPFMGNVVALGEEGALILAHCTAPITLASNKDYVRLKSHFETGRSVAVDVPLRRGEAVMIGCDHQLKDAYIAECYVDKSQLGHRNMCRTQVALRLKSETSKVLSKWPSGHAVLAIQVGLTEAKKALTKMGFEVEVL